MARTKVLDHVTVSGIVLDEVKVLYVPIPRAGSTSILWALAASEHLSEEHIVRSPKPEVTRALTIHDLSRWDDAHRLSARSGRERGRIRSSDDWFRFTVVREPVKRIWSAWVAKLLLREPRFVAEFGAQDWFPGATASPDDMVAAFRRFVAALGLRSESMYSQHWAAQADLACIDDVEYRVVGRVEDLPGTLVPVDAHLQDHGRPSLVIRQENATLVPFSPGVLDTVTARLSQAWTAQDAAAFGYAPVPGERALDPGWLEAVERLLPAIHAVVERNERIGDLSDLLTRSRES